MNRSSATYLSYLLRLWQEGETGSTWRSSLESVSTGEQRGFGNLDALFSFLRTQTSEAAASAEVWANEAAALDAEEVISQ